MIDNDCKCTRETEELWDWLGGPGYDGVHATPGRYYSDLTQALFASTPQQFVAVSRLIQRRRDEIAILTQELADIQHMLTTSLCERQKPA